MTTVNFYDKEQTDALIAPKANSAEVYTKDQADALLASKANSADVYTKTETSDLIDTKIATVVTKVTFDTRSYETLKGLLDDTEIGDMLILSQITNETESWGVSNAVYVKTYENWFIGNTQYGSYNGTINRFGNMIQNQTDKIWIRWHDSINPSTMLNADLTAETQSFRAIGTIVKFR